MLLLRQYFKNQHCIDMVLYIFHCLSWN